MLCNGVLWYHYNNSKFEIGKMNPNRMNRRQVIKQSIIALSGFVCFNSFSIFSNVYKMQEHNIFDVIIVGGSYAGLSAGMALGRSLRKVLIIDSGKPCNVQTPHSHNFITQDGVPPNEIAMKARAQVEKYDTVTFYNDLAVSGKKVGGHFEIETQAGDKFKTRKLIFATGVKDIMPDIDGFSACWGKSVIHCPYCHGYEYIHQPTGILANGEMAFELAKLINNWTKDLTIFTNGDIMLDKEQLNKLSKHHIKVVNTEIESLNHIDGYLNEITTKNGKIYAINVLYSRPTFVQHCTIPLSFGCELTEQNHLKVDMFQKTNIPGIYACGDNTTMMRAVAAAVASGNMAGGMANRDLIMENF